MPPIPSSLSILGIAKEATPGTAVPPTAFLRVTGLKPTPHTNYYDDDAFRGSAVKTYGKVAGVTWAEYEFDGPVVADGIGWPLAGILNDLTTTGAADPYTTTFAALNSGNQQPTSYTVTDYNGNNARAYAGSMFDKLDLAFTADGLLTYTAHALGMSYATATTPTASYTNTTPIPNWKCTATLGGAASAIVTDGAISLSRTVTPVHALDGTQPPNSVFAGGDIAVTGSMTLVYDTNGETVLGDYLAGTTQAITFDWVQTAASREVKAVMSQCVIDDATLNRSMGSYAQLAVKFTAVGNTTDIGASNGYSPIKFTTLSQIAGNTYK